MFDFQLVTSPFCFSDRFSYLGDCHNCGVGGVMLHLYGKSLIKINCLNGNYICVQGFDIRFRLSYMTDVTFLMHPLRLNMISSIKYTSLDIQDLVVYLS